MVLQVDKTVIQFTVFGQPEPQGSARLVPVKGYARPFITSDNPDLKKWRANVAYQAKEAMRTRQRELLGHGVPVEIEVEFVFKRPLSLKRDVAHKTTRPDTDKLVRGVLDALTGIVYDDDAQVIGIVASKTFGEFECAKIVVRERSCRNARPLLRAVRN
jgi:Holliday junction resolvase RusA-like endonuclease